jgi:hypothetical protein
MGQLSVEDHGNGFMVLGTCKIKKARKELQDYVEHIEVFRFATPTWYSGGRAVWLTTGPGEVWDGATTAAGEPLPR